ncbi:hypothetical protein TSUD_102460 [Trifolium subterraneum]|uniref:Uncharacterized protein n=1 Tax=Trifolium subterraneum TaxID=3900 RepID=A0A2Z6M5R9_TRISU|nr:hypothetical protein TSUD_102460 [Trifolium subterraneum]
MRRIERVNVALMLSGKGSASFNVFRMASSRWKKRRSKVLILSGTTFWGEEPKDYQNSEDEAKERAERAATAARRWREYSRKGVDKPPRFKLPEGGLNKNK